MSTYLPELTKMGAYVQQYLLSSEHDLDEDKLKLEFIQKQLLCCCQHLDYSDEVGRRLFFSMLGQHVGSDGTSPDIASWS